MKQKLFLLFLPMLFGILPASAQNEKKSFVNAGGVEHIVIANDMNVILMPGTANDKALSMDALASTQLDIQLSNKTMTVGPLRQSSKEKLIVYLYVNNLKTITAGNGSSVKTVGTLNSAKLDLYVSREGRMHILSKGIIRAHPVEDAEILVKYIQNDLLATY